MNKQQTHIGSCPAHWDVVKLGTIAELKHGYQFRSKDFTDEGVKIFKITQIKSDGSIDLSSCSYIDLSRLESFKKNIINKGDILMALSGATIGKIARFNSDETVLQNYRVGNFIPNNENILNKDFFYYFLSTDNTSYQILANQTQSAQENVGKENIHNMLVFCPPLAEQKKIAEVLSSLDEKIGLLHRQNKTLESMAETLFRQWFVEEAKEDWKIVRLKDYVKTNINSISRSYTHNSIKYLDTGSLTEGKIEALQELSLSKAPSRAKRLVEHNNVLISTVRPNQKHYGIVKNPEENLVVSTGFCVISCERIDPHFVYVFLTSSDMTEYLHSIAEGSTSAYPSLKPSDIEALEFQLPPEERLNDFADYCKNAWNKIEKNQKQILMLENMRDTLLPKLMSGEVRVE